MYQCRPVLSEALFLGVSAAQRNAASNKVIGVCCEIARICARRHGMKRRRIAANDIKPARNRAVGSGWRAPGSALAKIRAIATTAIERRGTFGTSIKHQKL